MAETSFVLITLLAVLYLLLYRDRLRHVASLFSVDSIVRDTGYGLSELRLPRGWRRARDLNDGAGIEVIDPVRRRYAIVFSESREDFDAAFKLDRYSADTRETLTSSVLVLGTSDPERRRVRGFDAIQYEIEVVDAMTELKYLHTAVLGRRAFHQLIAWAPRSCYSRPVFEKLIDGFREIPGPEPRPREHNAPGVRVVGPIGFNRTQQR